VAAREEAIAKVDRNDRTFRGTSMSAQQLALLIKEEADAWCRARFRKLGGLFGGG